MKKTKKILSPNQLLYYPDNIIKKLENLALQGWKLQKFNNFTITLEEFETKPLKYSFIISPYSSNLDVTPTQSQEQLIELCEDTGWEYVTMYSQMLVFSSELDDITPIDTDEKVKLETIHKSMKKEYLPGIYLGTAMMILLATMQLSSLKLEDFFTSIQLYTLSISPIVIIHGILNIFQYFHWYFKSQKDGVCAKPINFSWFYYITMTGMILMSLGILYSSTDSKIQLIGVPIALVTFLTCQFTVNLLRKKSYKTSTKWSICIVICTLFVIVIGGFTTKLVIDIQPTNDIKYDGYNYRTTNSRSILSSRKSYYINDTLDDISMDIKIYDSRLEFVNNQILSGVLQLSDWQIEGNISWDLTHHDDTHSIYTKFIDKEIDNSHQILSTSDKVFEINFNRHSSDEFKELVIIKLLELY